MYRFIRARAPVLVFIAIIFVLGIIFGAVAVKTVEYDMRMNMFNYFNNFMDEFKEIEANQQSIIAKSIKFNLINVLIIWMLGFTVFLMPIIVVLVFLKGFLLGFTVGFLIHEYSWRGIVIAVAAVFPQNLLIIPAYIFAAVTGIYYSLRIIKSFLKQDRLTGADFANYTAEMGLLALVLFGGSLIETFCSPFFMRIILHLF